LKILNNRLEDKGTLQVVTDFYPFHEWVLEQVPGTGFSARPQTIRSEFQTKYEKKWKAEGQEKFFEIHLQKRSHLVCPVKEDPVLKVFYTDVFRPEDFSLGDLKEDVAVIYREHLYDPRQQKMMIHLTVSEDHLIQDFWVTIVKTPKGWLIKKSQGQKFYPTPGIVRALRWVYESAARREHE